MIMIILLQTKTLILYASSKFRAYRYLHNGIAYSVLCSLYLTSIIACLYLFSSSSSSS